MTKGAPLAPCRSLAFILRIHLSIARFPYSCLMGMEKCWPNNEPILKRLGLGFGRMRVVATPPPANHTTPPLADAFVRNLASTILNSNSHCPTFDIGRSFRELSKTRSAPYSLVFAINNQSPILPRLPPSTGLTGMTSRKPATEKPILDSTRSLLGH